MPQPKVLKLRVYMYSETQWTSNCASKCLSNVQVPRDIFFHFKLDNKDQRLFKIWKICILV